MNSGRKGSLRTAAAPFEDVPGADTAPAALLHPATNLTPELSTAWVMLSTATEESEEVEEAKLIKLKVEAYVEAY